MKLFVIPNAIICEDGSGSIDIPVVTPEYIDRQIMNIEAVGKLNIDEKDVVDVVCFSRNTAESKTKPVTKFNISDNLADFLLEIGFGELNKYLNDAEFRKSEIAKWNLLREVIS